MREEELRDLLAAVRDGTTSIEETVRELRHLPVENLRFAQVDTHRELRQGLPEAIYAERKTPDQVVAIARALLRSTTGAVLATRVTAETAAALTEEWPEAVHHEICRVVVVRPDASSHAPRRQGCVAVVSAGTSDIPVAEEAAIVCESLGAEVRRVTDVGVAGVHRVLATQDLLQQADVVIVVAGMEGALPSLVGGITGAPVIAVPTSVGYGASFDGLAALLGMLNSCAAGVAVVNIDNGFGAATFAARLLRSRRS
jgi:NCAIR mutase (PurE)-related protein